MESAIVIGLGGTGKMTVSYLMKELGERTPDGRIILPRSVDMFAVDLDASEVSVPDPLSPTGQFCLDNSPGSPDIVILRGQLPEVLANLDQYPSISWWLSQQDASRYRPQMLVGEGEGAGQMRQLACLKLFLDDNAFVARFEQACKRVTAGKASPEPFQVFIVSSVAGGTGSGILPHVASIVRHLASLWLRPEVRVFGFLALPESFRSVISQTNVQEARRIRVNSYATLREIERLQSTSVPVPMNYGERLEFDLRSGPFDTLYLIDGSSSQQRFTSLSTLEPKYGIVPSISDAILLHMRKYLDYTALRTSLGSREEASFSLFGTRRIIYNPEVLRRSLSYALASGMLRLLTDGSGATDRGRQLKEAFLTSNDPMNPDLSRFSVTFRRSRGGVLSAETLLARLQIRDQKLDHRLPTVDFEARVVVAPMGGKGDPHLTKSEAQRLWGNCLGSSDDVLDPRRPTCNAVLNYYSALHKERFAEYLRRRALDVLGCVRKAQSDAPGAYAGGLPALAAMCQELETAYHEFVEAVERAYAEQSEVSTGGQRSTRREQSRAMLEMCEKEMLKDEGIKDYLDNHAEQLAYLGAYQQYAFFERTELTMQAVTRVAKDFADQCRALRLTVESWLQTLSDLMLEATIVKGLTDAARASESRSPVRRHVPEPGSRLQMELEQTMAGPAAAARAVSEQMGWCFHANPSGSPVLVLNTMVTDGLVSQGIRQIVLRDITDACRPYTAALDQWDVWDVMSRDNQTVGDIVDQTHSRLEDYCRFSKAVQVREPALLEQTSRACYASWRAHRGDEDSSGQLASAVRSVITPGECLDLEIPREIIGFTATHGCRLAACGDMESLEQEYRRGFQYENVEGAVPVHVLPEERAAAEYEARLETVLHCRHRTLSSKVVSLLRNDQALREFGLGLALGIIAEDVDLGTGKARFVIKIPNEIALSGTLWDSLVMFLQSDDALVSIARSGLQKHRTLLEERDLPAARGRLLECASSEVPMGGSGIEPNEKSRSVSPVVRDLWDVFRIIYREHLQLISRKLVGLQRGSVLGTGMGA